MLNLRDRVNFIKITRFISIAYIIYKIIDIIIIIKILIRLLLWLADHLQSFAAMVESVIVCLSGLVGSDLATIAERSEPAGYHLARF